MKKSNLFTAITLAISSGTLFSAIHEAKAGEVVALNTSVSALGITAISSTLPSKEASSDELLARGLARVAAAKQPEDYRIALNYFRMAAKKGNVEAQFQLAIMQLDNEHVDQDEEAAIRWLEKASKQGHKQAAIALDYVVNSGGDIGC